MSSKPEELTKSLEGVHTAFIITPGPTLQRCEYAMNAAKACK